MTARKEGGRNQDDWGHYFSVSGDCNALFLKKDFLMQSEESITFKRNCLCAEMLIDHQEASLDFFLDSLAKAAQSGEEIFAEVFYKQTREKFDLPEEVSNRFLWESLKKVGKAFRLIPNNAQKGYLQQKRLMVPDRIKRWCDAGMVDYFDANGNAPLLDKDRKLYVFTVSSFLTMQDVFKGQKPTFNKSGDEVIAVADI